MRQIIQTATYRREEWVDITLRVTVKSSGIPQGPVSVYPQGATAAILIH
jgi:thiamine phosphate synthase YjbQ (UPF0047 family)